MRGWFIARLVRGDNSSGEQRDRSTNAAAERTHARNIEVEVGNKAKPVLNEENEARNDPLLPTLSPHTLQTCRLLK